MTRVQRASVAALGVLALIRRAGPVLPRRATFIDLAQEDGSPAG